jgi:alpha-N-arabinofuranosidase
MGKARLGLSLVDSRGWDQTKSGIAVEGIENTPEWKRFEGVFGVLPDCPGVSAAWRLLSPNGKITGKVELRGLEVTAISRESYPAYVALTASASLSEDDRKLFLIVFNKHHAEPIEAGIVIAGFTARSARRWTVTGPSLEETNIDEELVRETESGANMAPPTAGSFRHVFPARSMTAIEFSR